MALASTQLQRGIVIDGQFELERPLGAGGMGTVWAATDLRLGRSVAVKFLSSAFVFDDSARQRFEREARLGGKIRSPHVVQIFSQGITDDGVPYVVMELLDGEDLSQRIARSGPCSLVETGSIIEQVCRGLARAHQAGLVHRDIKPHNIFLLPESGSQTFVKLLDFGIAKDVGTQQQSLTVSGSMLGTVLYCSPEQLRDSQSVGPQSDIWALGVVIYEMLTGNPPFDGETLPEVVAKITFGRYARASEVSPALPPAIDAFFERLLERDPALRMQSAEEVASALAKIVGANSSSVSQRSWPVGQSMPDVAALMSGTVARPAPARWPFALLVAALGASVGYYFMFAAPAANILRSSPQPAAAPVSARAALAAAPVKSADSSPAAAVEATPPAPAKAESHGQLVPVVPSQRRAPAIPSQVPPQPRPLVKVRVEPSKSPPPAAEAKPAAISSDPNLTPRKVKPHRDFGF